MTIDDDLLEAYRRTAYRVATEPPIVLRVDEESAALAALHAERGVASSAFITAWNPRSASLGEDDNAALHGQLLRSLAERGLDAIDGEGAADAGDWPPEQSLLVLGITRADAEALGAEFGQNAVLWAGEDATPRLLLLV